jgi:hypothetical protein
VSGSNGYKKVQVVYDKVFCLSVAGTSRHFVLDGQDVNQPSVKTVCGGTGFPMREHSYPSMRMCAKCVAAQQAAKEKKE